MLQITGDLFETHCDCLCIPTNGEWNEHGDAIMGAGVALEAKNRWPGIEVTLGKLLKKRGNYPFFLRKFFVPTGGENEWGDADAYSVDIRSFPTKNRWREKADIELIRQSATTLVRYVDWFHSESILLPRVGCGLGGLRWEDVEKVLEPIFDDRFVIVTHRPQTEEYKKGGFE